jgi:hypothetical protein
VGKLTLGEGFLSTGLVLAPLAHQHPPGEVVLAADLSGALVAGSQLPATLQFELPGVVSPPTGQSLLLDVDVTLHPISREVDLGSCPVETVHPKY